MIRPTDSHGPAVITLLQVLALLATFDRTLW